MLEERLLAQLDDTDEVRRDGRSAVLRLALEVYLRQLQQRSITERYQRAYGAEGGLGTDWTGWEEQGLWPDG